MEENQNKETTTLKTRVEKILNHLRPYIKQDGGDVELVSIRGTTAYVKLLGACSCCPSAHITLKAGIEQAIKEEIPEITAVEQI
ncbi:MAG: hypothetical protein RLZ12_71 [Bacillota bacterium]|jgi:Fe-S cluster biogenesis protein NfuA